MTVDDLITVWGSKAKAAAATGYARSTLTVWEQTGGIPYNTQCRLFIDFKRYLSKFPPSRTGEVSQAVNTDSLQ